MQKLYGRPVAEALTENLRKRIKKLREAGTIPKLCIVRVGRNEDDLSAQRAALRAFSSAGADAEAVELPETVSQEKLDSLLLSLNEDKKVHGVLLLQPLPEHLSVQKAGALIDAGKDVDCTGPANLARVLSGSPGGFLPCTPEAVLELLDFYQIALKGTKVTVIGCSPVVGKPLALLLLSRDATVTVCNSKTKNLAGECRRADLLISCAGCAKLITPEFVRKDQVVVDVGINMADGAICGDADFGNIADKVKAVTPVPGGVGAVTASILLKHTVTSAEREPAK